MTRRVAVFGGSFNPPHMAHVFAVAWILASDEADAVWCAPAAHHPFGKPLAPFPERVAMVRDAMALFGERVSVDLSEAEEGMSGYTVDLLDVLRRRHPGTEFSLLIGADILGETDRWKDWERIRAATRVHVVGRAGWAGLGAASALELPRVSSTAIRALAAAERWDELAAWVPAAVLRRVREGRWYQAE